MIVDFIEGAVFSDERGSLFYNNSFDASTIKRIYFIESNVTSYIRGWQGHQIEQRWFSVVKGEFKIQLIRIDNWESPSKTLKVESFSLSDKKFDVLHIPKGFVTSIQSLVQDSKLMVLSDYLLDEVKDEFRYPIDYF